MTKSEYVQQVVELIDSRPRRIDLDKLLDEICVRAKIAASRRDRQERPWATSEQIREKSKKRTTPTSEYAQKIVELIDARPRHIDLDKLLDEIDFHAQNAEAERDIQEGRVVTHEQAMEEMWRLIYSKFNGRNGRAKTMQRSSMKSQRMRH